MNLQYGDSMNLRARAQIYELFGSSRIDRSRWVFDQLDLPDSAHILELGCGPGALWSRNRDRTPAGWHLKLTDRSEGMVEEAQARHRDLVPNLSFEVVDSQKIAYDAGSFDAVIANHMLYHLDDRDRALSLIRSALKKGGSLYAATNGIDHLRKFKALVRRVKTTEAWSATENRFSLENGTTQLAHWFEHVEIRRLNWELRVTETRPLIDYAQSTDRSRLDEAEQRRFAALVEQEISVSGSLRITTAPGMFVATKTS